MIRRCGWEINELLHFSIASEYGKTIVPKKSTRLNWSYFSQRALPFLDPGLNSSAATCVKYFCTAWSPRNSLCKHYEREIISSASAIAASGDSSPSPSSELFWAWSSKNHSYFRSYRLNITLYLFAVILAKRISNCSSILSYSPEQSVGKMAAASKRIPRPLSSLPGTLRSLFSPKDLPQPWSAMFIYLKIDFRSLFGFSMRIGRK